MKKKYFVICFLLIILILGTCLRNKKSFFKSSANEELFRDTNHLILTKHARCRMDCRHITTEEIKQIVHNGNVNYSRSSQGRKGSDTYALEGYSNDHQHIRVVVAPENGGLVVITCIDLDREWACNCY